jgi:hypothetical protein
VVFFNYTTMQVTAKIVYYGPGLGGKTSNLQFIHQKTAPKSRGEMVSLETEADRTLFFDLLPLDVGVIGGMKVRLQLYTVPGQVFYNATRKLVLKGVDGVVFVADSQLAMQDANVESLRNLEANLAEMGMAVDQVPLVFQYNKRDLRSIQSIEQLNATLNPRNTTYCEAAAVHGIGVFETLKAISRQALSAVRQRLVSEDPSRRPASASAASTPPTPVTSPSAPVSPRPEPAAASPAAERRPNAAPSADPLAALLPDGPPEDIKVEFAESDTDEHVRPVETKGVVDIHQELESLRTLASTGSANRTGAPRGKNAEQRLQDMLVADRDARQELKRKAGVEVQAALLKGATRVSVHLAFEVGGREELVRDVVQVALVGNKRLERLLLHLDLDVKGRK